VVKKVNRVIDAATNTFRVGLQVTKPGGTQPAALRFKATLRLKLPRAAPAAAAVVVVPRRVAPAQACNFSDSSC
jgi:hypothetical protein